MSPMHACARTLTHPPTRTHACEHRHTALERAGCVPAYSCALPACNVARICAVMTDASVGDEVARLANISAAQV